ncbi:MAG: ATP-binding protein [Bacteroidota bacterium]
MAETNLDFQLMNIAELSRWVSGGEDKHLEFKRKARHLDKIARELVAFANTDGGHLLVGVDDDGKLFGVKEAEADYFALERFLEQYVKPALPLKWQLIPITSQREVLVLEILPSKTSPHFLYAQDDGPRQKVAFVRVRDKSVQASREMVRVLRYLKRKQGVSLRIGEPEQTLLQYLETVPNITLAEAQKLLNISRRNVSQKLVLLVSAGLLRLRPGEKADRYSLIQKAFK